MVRIPLRPRLLDLFCGQGGAAVGYHRAGFDVVGVDVEPQPHYPFEFHRGDAMTWPLDGFDAVHASPPCQRFSVTRNTHDRDYPDLLTPTIDRLRAQPLPWVIENVPGAPMPGAIELCGAAFGCNALDIDGAPLVLRRHRLFLSNVLLLIPECACGAYRRMGVRVGGVYGGGPENRRLANRNLGTFRGGYTPTKAVAAALIGVEHMTKAGLAQAIPPAYTEHIGRQLIGAVR
jgi:DNA (cytosine-5)-methyltransferase 1